MELHINKSLALREFEKWAHSYDRSILNLLIFRPSYRIMLGRLRKKARRSKGNLRILDIGCGTGTYLANCLATDLGIEAVGLDMAYNMIHKAKAKAEGIPGNNSAISFTVGDAEHLPFEPGYFDMITCANSFHHYPHQDRALREMRRVLNTEGELVIIDGHRDDPLGYLIFDVFVDAIEKQVSHCSRRNLIKLCKAVGFRKVTQRMHGLFPPILITTGQA